MSSSDALLIELGCEEIPAGVVPVAAEALGERLIAALDEAGLSHGEVRCYGTPRRIAVHVESVQTRQQDRTDEVVGPSAKVAFDADGQPTRAAQGFARGQGVDPAVLYTVDTPKGPYAALKRDIVGRETAALLVELLPALLRGLPFPKRMRWGRETEAYIRPVHWLVALLGDSALDFEFAGVRSGRLSQGHRFLGAPVEVASADRGAWMTALRGVRVMVDPRERRDAILAGARELAAGIGAELVEDDETLDEVTYLVEWPFPLLGSFDPAFLAIPDAVIFTTLRENQRLFTIRDAQGRLTNRFVAVANTLREEARQAIAVGNARVVSARLADARFFYLEDTKAPLVGFVDRLAGQVWLDGMGTVRDRVDRIVALAGRIAARHCPERAAEVARAALLCKADLSTRMVFEFPELQGIIGEDYARVGGEDAVVAQAIREHYLPRGAGDELPASDAGAVVALADKIEAIVACFALGLKPTGTQDQYALRRAALGIVQIGLSRAGWGVSLRALVADALAVVATARPEIDADALAGDVLSFFRGRLRAWFAGDYRVDLVEAVLAADFDRLADIRPRLDALRALQQDAGFEPLAAAFKRVGNLVRKAELDGHDGAVDPARFEVEAERTLYAEATRVGVQVRGYLAAGDPAGALAALVVLKPTVDGFFDDVMVMCDDVAVRNNRLALLRETAALFGQLADFSRIQIVREGATS